MMPPLLTHPEGAGFPPLSTASPTLPCILYLPPVTPCLRRCGLSVAHNDPRSSRIPVDRAPHPLELRIAEHPLNCYAGPPPHPEGWFHEQSGWILFHAVDQNAAV